MTFSNFANILKPIIGGSDNTVEFTRKLFIAMIGEDNFTIIENKSDDSFKAYYNGKQKINGIAREISPVADLENFVYFLDKFGDSVSEKLYDAFSGSIDEINLQNVNYKIASCFDEIIKKAAAATQRKSTQQSTNCETTSSSINSNEKRTTIQNQINVVQNGNNNLNLTNTGTIEFNFGGANKWAMK